MYIGKLWRDGGRYFAWRQAINPAKSLSRILKLMNGLNQHSIMIRHRRLPRLLSRRILKKNTQGGSEAFIKEITFLSE